MFTIFLEDDKKSTAANSAQILTTPKLYPRKTKRKVRNISFVITLVILAISIIINLFLLLPPKKTSSLSQVEELAVTELELSGLQAPLSRPDELLPVDNNEPAFKTMPICSTTSTFKSWMDYGMITSHSSRQWKLQRDAKTDLYGYRRYNGYYMVAMASKYGPVGTKYIITFSSGETLSAIIGDVKAKTDCSHPDGSMLEMIVDSTRMPISVRDSGNYNSLLTGTITEIRVVEGIPNNERK